VNKTHICPFKAHTYSESLVVTEISQLPPKKQTTVSLDLIVMLAANQCTRKFTLHLTLVLNICRQGIKQSGRGITFVYNLNVLWNLLFGPNEITNSRIVIGIYLSATLYIYHSEPKRDTTNLGQTESQILTVRTLKEMSKPNLSMSIKIK
jgi:hypothetical protein